MTTRVFEADYVWAGAARRLLGHILPEVTELLPVEDSYAQPEESLMAPSKLVRRARDAMDAWQNEGASSLAFVVQKRQGDGFIQIDPLTNGLSQDEKKASAVIAGELVQGRAGDAEAFACFLHSVRQKYGATGETIGVDMATAWKIARREPVQGMVVVVRPPQAVSASVARCLEA